MSLRIADDSMLARLSPKFGQRQEEEERLNKSPKEFAMRIGATRNKMLYLLHSVRN